MKTPKRHLNSYFCPAASRRLNLDRAAQRFKALLNAGKTQPAFDSCRQSAGDVKAFAVVLYGTANHGAGRLLDVDRHPSGPRMLCNVGQRFLHGSIESNFD